MAKRKNTCQLCGTRTRFIAVCSGCQWVAEMWLGEHGLDDPEAVFESIPVRRLNRTCYLCGEARSEHADHVVPKSKGGSDHWSNIGAACAKCNISKYDTEGITPEQQERLEAQHRAMREAYDRLTMDAWLDVFHVEVAEMVEDIDDGFEYDHAELEELFEEYLDDNELPLGHQTGAAAHIATWLIRYQRSL
jgi:hypothetical protein